MHFVSQSLPRRFVRAFLPAARAVLVGSLSGALAGVGLGLMWDLTPRELDAAWLTAASGAVLGAVPGAIAALLMPGVAVWRVTTACVLGVIATGAVGLAAGGLDWSFGLSFLGFGLAVLTMRTVTRSARGRAFSGEWLAWVVAAGLVGSGASGAAATHERAKAPALLRASLNLDALPRSAHDISCTSYGFTDLLATCVFTIHPDEFPSVVRGWDFDRHGCTGMSHGATGGPAVGANFPVEHCYMATPAEFQHGGLVRLFADRDRRRVMTDLYIE